MTLACQFKSAWDLAMRSSELPRSSPPTKMDLTLEVSKAALKELAKVGFDPVFGARPLKRAIQQRIENPLSKLLLEGKFLPKSIIPVDVDPIRAPGEFSFARVVH
jgi:ATP-dependent Clp protease ATP-binding subunit ClpB